MSFWEDELDAAMNLGHAPESYEETIDGLLLEEDDDEDDDEDVCPHGLGFDEICEDCDEEEDEQ